MLFLESVETTFSAAFRESDGTGQLRWHGHNLTSRAAFRRPTEAQSVVAPAAECTQAVQAAISQLPVAPAEAGLADLARNLSITLDHTPPPGAALHYLDLSYPGHGLRLASGETLFITTAVFSAAHRTHAPRLTDAENLALYGICDNPAGHGHNYRAAVWHPLPTAVTPALWAEFDHRNLSVDIPDLRGRNVVTEAIAELLARRAPGAARLRVWETPDFYAEYLPATTRYRLGRRYHFSAVHDLPYGGCGGPGIHGHDFSVIVVVSSPLDPRTEAAFDLGVLDRLAGEALAPLRHANLSTDVPALAGQPATPSGLSIYLFDALNRELGTILCAVGTSALPHQMSWNARGANE